MVSKSQNKRRVWERFSDQLGKLDNRVINVLFSDAREIVTD